MFLVLLTIYKFSVYDKKENNSNITENNKDENNDNNITENDKEEDNFVECTNKPTE